MLRFPLNVEGNCDCTIRAGWKVEGTVDLPGKQVQVLFSYLFNLLQTDIQSSKHIFLCSTSKSVPKSKDVINKITNNGLKLKKCEKAGLCESSLIRC